MIRQDTAEEQPAKSLALSFTLTSVMLMSFSTGQLKCYFPHLHKARSLPAIITTMRKPTDVCLLCQANLATKTNSHIYPKFLSTNFLGAKGTPRKGFDLSSDKILDGKPKVIQDSPKESYILCEDCEAYFSILEGIASDTFINWRVKVDKGEYSSTRIIDDLDIIECNTADKKTMHLLIYSIFWRVSVSEMDFFKNIKIVADFEEELRTTLMTYRQSKRADYFYGS